MFIIYILENNNSPNFTTIKIICIFASIQILNEMAYSEKEKTKIFNDICTNVVENKMSFNKAIDGSPITLMTFYTWLTKNDSFKEVYKYARDIRSDVLFEEIIEIADTTEEGVKTKDTPKGMITETGDMIDHRRLKIDARKWVVSKMSPKKYGDKPEIDEENQSDNEITITIVDNGNKRNKKV